MAAMREPPEEVFSKVETKLETAKFVVVA